MKLQTIISVYLMDVLILLGAYIMYQKALQRCIHVHIYVLD